MFHLRFLRIPLVRAVLADGSTILGVRVRLEQVEEMRRAAPPPSSDVMLLQEVEGLNAPVLAASEADFRFWSLERRFSCVHRLLPRRRTRRDFVAVLLEFFPTVASEWLFD